MQVEAYLTFGGRCEEALKFYEKALGGRIVEAHRYAGSPMDNGQLPPEYKNKLMHATFEAGNTRFMASDGMPGQAAPSYSGFSMSVNVPKDAGRGQQLFDSLAQGGKVTMPFAKQFWGAQFGMLVDKFGVPWMVNCNE